MAGHKRATNVEYQSRIETLMKLRAQGCSDYHIILAACQQWGLSVRQGKRYLQKVDEAVSALGKQPIEVLYSQVLNKLDYLYQQALKIGDTKLALRVAKDRERLLRAVQKYLQHPSQSNHAGLLSTEELEKALKEINGKSGKNP